MIQLTHGSIFDKKCDLLVIPCNNMGGITSWVFSNLKENSLPLPPRNIPFGHILFYSTKGNLENAEIVGFAASVEAIPNRSTKDAITNRSTKGAITTI